MNEFQCVVVRSPIGCGGRRDEWRDEPIESQGLLQRIVVFEREKTSRTPRARRPARKRSVGLWVCRFVGDYPQLGRPSPLQTYRPTNLLEQEPHAEPRLQSGVEEVVL